MSLTSHLKDKNSAIKQLFDNKFINIDYFLKEENSKLKDLSTILPLDETKYPWQIVGHITEYLLAIHMELPLTDLFPMQLLKHFNNQQFEKIKSYGINKSHLNTQYFFNIVSKTLYHLACYESEFRSKGGSADYNLHNKHQLSDIAFNDIERIYKESILKTPLFNGDGSFVYNPTFDENFSKYIGGADADLIQIKKEGNFLIDLKTTKNSKLEKSMIFQLLGYVALDQKNIHHLKTIGVYFTRQSKVVEYDIETILKEYSTFTSIADLRNAFGFSLVSSTFPDMPIIKLGSFKN